MGHPPSTVLSLAFELSQKTILMLYRVLLFLGVVLLVFSCKKEAPNVIVEFCPEVFDAREQKLIGEQVDFYIKNDSLTFPILSKVEYEAAYAYVGQLFQSMVDTRPLAENRSIYNFNLNIIHNDTMRTAFFVPGGEFYIYTGLLKFLDAEHQLLSIIAHELYYANTELIPSTIKEQEIVDCFDLGDLTLGREVPAAADFAVALPTLEFSENLVIEADSFAISILCPFLYEPLGLREIILKADESVDNFQWLEYRSANKQQRIQETSRLASDCDLGGVRNEEMYQEFKAQLPF